MTASSRSQPFCLIFHPNGPDKDPGPYKSTVLHMNAPPVEIENAHFKGQAVVLHDTGSEPGADDSIPLGKRRGFMMQIQGRFKRPVQQDQNETCQRLWAGGELPKALQLGWFTQQVVEVCVRYLKWLMGGNVCFAIGDETELPHLSFPLGNLFTCLSSPPGTEAPQLGSEELWNVEWSEVGCTDICVDNTYTLLMQTSFLDVCSWQLLNIPGVSPLPIENIVGDLCSAQITIFDLGSCEGVQHNWREGTLLHWVFTRGVDVDTSKLEQQEDLVPSSHVETQLESSSTGDSADLGLIGGAGSASDSSESPKSGNTPSEDVGLIGAARSVSDSSESLKSDNRTLEDVGLIGGAGSVSDSSESPKSGTRPLEDVGLLGGAGSVSNSSESPTSGTRPLDEHVEGLEISSEPGSPVPLEMTRLRIPYLIYVIEGMWPKHVRTWHLVLGIACMSSVAVVARIRRFSLKP